ncbi:MAG TPA: nodulation protein NfeD [Gammaproteobacteria bacterium]|jgi:membrane-bound serine protease (ClpP class)|nr:nodulation protein NfeD [Gammaproteobacteria bacterium]
MKKIVWFFIGFLMLAANAFAARPVYLLDINGAIGPATESYIENGLATAAKEKAAAVIIQLNTPGGLETSMRGINQTILNSSVPVVAYVAPAGARAASAGTFIMYASHIAAMAPGTNVGAASPVSMETLGSSGDSNNKKTLQKKSMNDAFAYIQGLAKLRDRNVEWAGDAVSKAASLDATEALNQKVINFIATDIPELLKKIDGQTVDIKKIPVQINTKDIEIKNLAPNWRSKFLSVITNPSIAYILLLIGIYGLFFELANPGFILPGVVGTFSLLIGLYAFQLLPISYVGLTLLLLGIAFMIAEAFVTSYGLLGVGGFIAFVVGSIFLFDTSVPGFHIAWSIIIVMSLISVGLLCLIIWLTTKSIRQPVVTGREALIGTIGEVLEYYTDYMLVRVQGEIWNAQCEERLQVGQKVRVTKIGNLKLTVEPLSYPEK